MKTTLEIPDAIFRRAKSLAAERGIPFRALVSEAVVDKLQADERPWQALDGGFWQAPALAPGDGQD